MKKNTVEITEGKYRGINLLMGAVQKSPESNKEWLAEGLVVTGSKDDLFEFMDEMQEIVHHPDNDWCRDKKCDYETHTKTKDTK